MLSREERQRKLEMEQGSTTIRVSKEMHNKLLALKLALNKETNEEVLDTMLKLLLINLDTEILEEYEIFAKSRGIREPLNPNLKHKLREAKRNER